MDSHLSYTARGRLFQRGRQRVYKSGIAQENIRVGDAYVPYVWDAATGVARFGRMRAQFTPSGVAIGRVGEASARTLLQLTPETNIGGLWERRTATRSQLVVREIDNGIWTPRLEFRLSVGTADQVATMRLQVGGNNSILLGLDIEATEPGRHRVVFDYSTNEVPSAAPRGRPGYRDARGNKLYDLAPTLYRFNEMQLRWSPHEVDDHQIDADDQLVRLAIGDDLGGRGGFTRGERRSYDPETLGPVDIANDDDDGDEDDSTTWDNQGIYGSGYLYVEGWDVFHIGLGWRAIDLDTTTGVDSIDSGTQVTVYHGDDDLGTVANCSQYFVEGGGSVWGSSNRPSQQTATASGGVSFSSADPGDNQPTNISAQAAIEELVVTDGGAFNGNAGEDMYAWLETTDTEGIGWSAMAHDYDAGAQNSELTIVYTPTAAGGDVTAFVGTSAVAASDGTSASRSRGRYESESLEMLDTPLNWMLRQRMATDLLITADLAIPARTRGKVEIDTLAAADGFVNARTRSNDAVSTLDMDDSELPYRQRNRQTTDLLDIGDLGIPSRTRGRSPADEVLIAYGFVNARTRGHTEVSSLDVTDASSESRHRNRSVTTNVSVASDELIHRIRTRIVGDGISIVDSYVKVIGGVQAAVLTSVTEISDGTLVYRIKNRIAGDAIGVLSDVSAARARGRLETSGIETADGSSRSAVRGLTAEETIEILDAVSSFAARSAVLTDTIEPASDALQWRAWFRSLLDTLDIDDDYIRSIVLDSGSIIDVDIVLAHDPDAIRLGAEAEHTGADHAPVMVLGADEEETGSDDAPVVRLGVK